MDVEAALAHLRRIPGLAEAIAAAGPPVWPDEADLFTALAKGLVRRAAPDAFPFVWQALLEAVGPLSPEGLREAGDVPPFLGKKTAAALLGVAKAARAGTLERLFRCDADEAVAHLCRLRGVDAPLALEALIAAGRPDVLSPADPVLGRALRRLGVDVAGPEAFAALRTACSPHGSVAALCLHAFDEASRPVFPVGADALGFLRAKDKRLGVLMGRLGPLRRRTEPDLFAALVHSVIAQQISGKAAQSISDRLLEAAGALTAERLASLELSAMRACGLSERKASTLRRLAETALSGGLDLEALRHVPDEEVIRRLAGLDGIGVWTAEMLLIFSLCRPDVLSWGDFGIRRGMALLYGDRELTRERFERRRRRYAPYGSVVSLYLWALAGMEDALARKVARGQDPGGCGGRRTAR